MPHITTDDGVRLYCEESGTGIPVVFVHEFAGDHRSWEPQIRYFSRFYRCVAFSARGYPPSDVPGTLDRYSQDRATADIAAIVAGLKLEAAHVVGLSMGGYATLHFGLKHPRLSRSLTIAGCGYGAKPSRRAAFQEQSEIFASLFEKEGSAVAAERYANVPTRLAFRAKDPRGWDQFMNQLKEHSPIGSALTLRGVQMRRPSLWDLVDEMRRMRVPTLVINGDDDEPCLVPGLLMKQTIPGCGLLVLPRSGHAMNLEEPDAFNRALGDFLHAVDTGRMAPTGGA